MRFALLAAAFLALSCTVRPEQHDLGSGPVYLEGFTWDEAGVVLAALDEWSRATGGELEFAPVIGAAPENAWTIRRSTLPAGQGKAWPSRRLVLIDADAITPPGQPVFEERLRAVVLHELGHAIGVFRDRPNGGHVEGTLMGAHAEIGCIDEVTIAAACEITPCGAAVTTCGSGATH